MEVKNFESFNLIRKGKYVNFNYAGIVINFDYCITILSN